MWKWLPIPVLRMFRGIVDRAGHLSWLLFLLGVLLLIPALGGVLSAFYHPNGFFAPYAYLFGLSVVVYTGTFLLFGATLRLVRRSGAKKPIATGFAIVVLTLPITAITVVAIAPPQPSSFLQYAGHDAYQIPRVFTRQRDGVPDDRSSLGVTYCANDGTGFYKLFPFNCHQSDVTLSKWRITDTFDPSYTLDHMWKVPRNEEIITDVVALARQTNVVPGDGWTGYTYGNGSYRRHAVLDADNRLVLFGRCSFTRCHMLSQTSAGLLTFTHLEGPDFNYRRWKEQEEEILDLLGSWRLAD